MDLKEIIEKCNTLSDIAICIYNKNNYYNRKRVKKILLENNIDFKEWKESKRKKPNICLFCGKEIEGKNSCRKKFCNSSCAASFNNKQRGSLSEETKEKISNSLRKDKTNKNKNTCLKCGKTLKKGQKNYCSNECRYKSQKENYINKWKSGLVNGLSGKYNLNKIIRNYLLEKNDFKCEICGWGEKNIYTDKIPLEVHHIDGNYLNNKEENLQVLCPNCHSLTNTYKSHNKTGRKNRNIYN